MSTPTYRVEDELRERSNAVHLHKMFSDKDYQGVLEMALMLNYQASFNNSRAYWAIQEAAKNMSQEFSIDKYKKMIEELT